VNPSTFGTGRYVEADLARTLERELTETERLRFGADADRRRLRTEVERLKGWFADPHALHAHCLRTLTEGQIAHLFGERMTEIVNRAEKAEAEIARMKLYFTGRPHRPPADPA